MTTLGADTAIPARLSLEALLLQAITASGWSRTRSPRRGRHANPRRWHRWI